MVAGSLFLEGSHDLDAWGATAKRALASGVAPGDIEWTDPEDGQQRLYEHAEPGSPPGVHVVAVHVPREFVALARAAICHRDVVKWKVLYRVLWRVHADERSLLAHPLDDDVVALRALVKGVQRDAHKMKAFVRFRRVVDPASDESYIAYHRPEHRVVRLVAPFFARRFGVMRWAILTPFGSACWDGTTLAFGPPAERRAAPAGDALEELWRTYYASVFNPARANPRAMTREMPRRYWSTLPEAPLIDRLLADAQVRTRTMTGERSWVAGGAAAFVPAVQEGIGLTLPVLRDAARACRGCDLHACATRVVFGEGPGDARIMLVGEQPGDMEDLEGRPFVGPAGHVLDAALCDAGLERSACYLTNAVKHFKWTPDPRGKRRIHARPHASEIRACRAWLDEEVALVRPDVLVLLGGTAASSVLGAGARVTALRGKVLRDVRHAPCVIVTLHPSALLRAVTEESRQRLRAELVHDLSLARRTLKAMTPVTSSPAPGAPGPPASLPTRTGRSSAGSA